MTTSRSGRIAPIAALLLIALAPAACRKEEEPIDEPGANLSPLRDDFDGSWRSAGPGECTQLAFEFGVDKVATFSRSPNHLTYFEDLYRLENNGLTGSVPDGLLTDCVEPHKQTFLARGNGSGLDVSWFCLGDDAVPSVKTRYERGSCPESGNEPMTTDMGEPADSDGDGYVDSLQTEPGWPPTDTTATSDDGSDPTTRLGEDSLKYPPVADGERERGPLCKPGETFTQYVAPPEACARCEQSCRQQCEQLDATLLGSCRLCDQSPDGGTCGHCLKVCLFPEQYR